MYNIYVNFCITMYNIGLKHLSQLALDRMKITHPNNPYPYAGKFSDRTANGLTQCVIKFLQLNGHQAERISTTGRPMDQTRIVKDVLGHHRRIGSVQWIPGTTTRGSADISATINGRSVKIEVKIKDRQSPAQVEYQRQVEQAGGIYLIVHTFEEFYNWYNAR